MQPRHNMSQNYYAKRFHGLHIRLLRENKKPKEPGSANTLRRLTSNKVRHPYAQKAVYCGSHDLMVTFRCQWGERVGFDVGSLFLWIRRNP